MQQLGWWRCGDRCICCGKCVSVCGVRHRHVRRLGRGVNQGVFVLVPRLAARWSSSDPWTCQHIHGCRCRHQTHHSASSWNTGMYQMSAVSASAYGKCIHSTVYRVLLLLHSHWWVWILTRNMWNEVYVQLRCSAIALIRFWSPFYCHYWSICLTLNSHLWGSSVSHNSLHWTCSISCQLKLPFISRGCWDIMCLKFSQLFPIDSTVNFGLWSCREMWVIAVLISSTQWWLFVLSPHSHSVDLVTAVFGPIHQKYIMW